MKKKKVLLIGNSSCVNRGDAAILDGLINGINQIVKDRIEITATSYHYFESEILLGHPLTTDFSYNIKGGFWDKFSLTKKIKSKYLRFYEIVFLTLSVKLGSNRIPSKFKNIAKEINKYDIIIQVGGSYFVDVYTPLKYVSVAISILLQKPIYLAGHSIGPFDSRKSKLIPRVLFEKVNKIFLREENSLEHLKKLKIDLSNIITSTDTAWLIPEFKYNAIFHEEVKSKKPLIAITVRNLAPFDAKLGIQQVEYERLYINLLNKLIAKGYHIIGVAMGTGFGKYGFDDRIPALRIQRKLDLPNEMTVLMHEYNHLEVGYILSKCELLIGTRLHSVILSMRYNTPAIAIYYEHKSLGILTKMKMAESSFFIRDIGNRQFQSIVEDILNNQTKYKSLIEEKVNIEREIGLKMLKEILL